MALCPRKQSERPMSSRSHRFTQEDLNLYFLQMLGKSVLYHGSPNEKPMDVDLQPPLPPRIRVYLYNATSPRGGRTLGECKVQLIVPGQRPGQKGNFNHSGRRSAILVGYNGHHDVFVLWDAGLHSNFAYSKNVQIKPETLYAASAGRIATQERRLRLSESRGVAVETVVAARSTKLMDALCCRAELTRRRMLQGR